MEDAWFVGSEMTIVGASAPVEETGFTNERDADHDDCDTGNEGWKDLAKLSGRYKGHAHFEEGGDEECTDEFPVCPTDQRAGIGVTYRLTLDKLVALFLLGRS